VIGVHVGVDNVPNLHPGRECGARVQVDILDRIDDGADTVTATAKQIRRGDWIDVEELPEDHERTPDRLTPMTPNLRAVASLVVPRNGS
jgi:hypothetical protein